MKFDLSESVTEVFEKHFNTLFSKIEELEKKIDEKSLNKYSAKSSTKSKTSQKLVHELSKSEYAAKSLIFGAMNVKK